MKEVIRFSIVNTGDELIFLMYLHGNWDNKKSSFSEAQITYPETKFHWEYYNDA